MVDVNVADLGLGKPTALGRALTVFGQPRDTVAHETAVERAAGQRRDALAQAAQNLVEGKQCAAPELNDNGLLGLSEGRAARPLWAHRLIGRRGAPTPLLDRLGVQPVAGSEDAGCLLRRLELGSNARRCAGAAV